MKTQNEKTKAPPPAPDGDKTASAGNVDKIRDILFGAQLRDYEKRLARAEERVVKETGELNDDLRRRFESLESFLKHELEDLNGRLKAEREAREHALAALAAELKEASKAFERRIAQSEEQNTQTCRELRRQLLEQSKNAADELRQKHGEMTLFVERRAAELADRKTDRAALAALLTEVAMRLAEDSEAAAATAGDCANG